MNPEQQLIAIAEACGWRCAAAFKEAVAYWVRPNGMDHETEFIPNYLNDLNAMHEAEKVLTTAQATTMSQYLHRRLGMLWGFATAAQRAEAFLRTMGKWKE